MKIRHFGQRLVFATLFILLPVCLLSITPAAAQDTTKLSSPRLLGLPDGTQTNVTRPILSWEAVPRAVSYFIQIDDTSDFSSPVQQAEIVNDTHYTTFALTGTYYWRVTPRDEAGKSGEPSVTWAFTVNALSTSGYYCDQLDPNRTFIQFAGITWRVKDGTGLDPGRNNWSKDNVSVDAQGRLHLKLTKVGNDWYSAEICTDQFVQYGQFRWFVNSSLNNLDPNVVLGMFAYRNNHGEIDTEVAKFGNATPGAGNAQYVVQPAPQHYIYIGTPDPMTLGFNWQPSFVHFNSFYGHGLEPASPGDEILDADWSFTTPRSYIPRYTDNLRAYINLWLCCSNPPAPLNSPPSNEIEIVIEHFTKGAEVVNKSESTQCAEDDNINIPLQGDISTFPSPNPEGFDFQIVATHPTYRVGEDNGVPDFRNCTPNPAPPGGSSTCTNLFDDGVNVVHVCTEPGWWTGHDMPVSVIGGSSGNGHRLVLSQKIVDENSWPQYLVLYQDGNLRLKPQPPQGVKDTLFGTSVLIGPQSVQAPCDPDRPCAQISSIVFNPTTMCMDVTYTLGGTATICTNVNRAHAVVQVDAHYASFDSVARATFVPFATVRSMWVTNTNTDASRIQNPFGNFPILTGWEYLNGPWWRFYRPSRSAHNTSAPDIMIETFTIPAALPPYIPKLTEPAGYINDNVPSFLWEPVPTATSYHIQVDNNSNFASPEIDQSVSDASYTPSTSLTDGVYRWRVKALNDAGETAWGPILVFTLDITAPTDAPVQVAPTDGSTSRTNRPTFRWRSVAGATCYQIQLDTVNPPVAPPVTVTGLTYVPPGPLLSTEYWWRVRACDRGNNFGPWSNPTWSIIIQPPATGPIIIDRFATLAPLLTWQNISGVLAYQVQVDDDPRFRSPEFDVTVYSTETQLPQLWEGIWYVRVRGFMENRRWATWSNDSFVIDLP